MSAYPDADWLDRQVRNLISDVSDLESRYATLSGQADEADLARSEIAAQVEVLEEQHRDAQDEMENARGELAELRQQLRNLTGRVRWLEQQVRAAEGIEPVELDSVPGAPELITRISKADQARARLLGDSERQQLSGQVGHYEELRERQRHYLSEALRHSKTISETAPADPARGDAPTRFAAARDQHRAFARNAGQQQNAATAARGRLEADDQRRHESGPVITDGERARTALQTRARATISSAVERRALLPVWFTTAVGYEPPSRGTESWLAAAAGLLAYRLAYAVTDAVNALGPPADEAADPARAQWRADLTRELERARQLT